METLTEQEMDYLMWIAYYERVEAEAECTVEYYEMLNR